MPSSSPPPNRDDLPPDRREWLEGLVRAEREVAEGGQGWVYEAQMRVAVKVPSASHAQRRLHYEVKALKQVDSEHVVRLLAYDEASGAIIMEWAPGQTLEAYLESLDAPPSLGWTVTVAKGIARGLMDIHAHGLVHRDLNPSNIKVHEVGERVGVKILDLGLVKHKDSQATRSNAGLGTQGYMAPEQGTRPKQVTHLADLFNLGLVIRRCLGETPPKERGAGRELWHLLDKLCELEPSKRPQSAEEVWKRLAAIQRRMDRRRPVQPELPTTAVEGAVDETAPRRYRWWVLAAIVLGAGVWGVGFRAESSAPAPSAVQASVPQAPVTPRDEPLAPAAPSQAPDPPVAAAVVAPPVRSSLATRSDLPGAAPARPPSRARTPSERAPSSPPPVSSAPKANIEALHQRVRRPAGAHVQEDKK